MKRSDGWTTPATLTIRKKSPASRGPSILLRGVEADLARDLSRLTQKDKYFYSDDNQAPSSYKKLVDEYYKALAKGKP